MADVEVDIVEPRPLDLVVVRARDDVARREFGARVIIGHVAAAGNGVLEDSPFAAHRLGDQEIIDVEMIEAGRGKMPHFHSRNATTRAPRYPGSVTRSAPRGGADTNHTRAAVRETGGQ